MNQGEHPQELLLNKSQISIQDLEPILSALSYFDIFKHPLTLNELFLNVHYITFDFDRFKKLVDYGIEEKIINKKDNYYFLGNESNIARRQQGEELVVNLTRRARFCVKLISLFPFTRSVMISGSFSKGYMDKNADIDFFIVTQPKRLWICRTMLIIYKKLFLLNSRKYFCLNYFVDADTMEINDKNIFTATEITYLLPQFNMEVYNQFLYKNKWAQEIYYPNFKREKVNEVRPAKFLLTIKNGFEFVLKQNVFNGLENFCKKQTTSFWQRKFKNEGPAWFKNQLQNTAQISKHHPNGYRNKVLEMYEMRMAKFSKNDSIPEGSSE